MSENLKLKCLGTIIGSNGANKPGATPSLKDLGIEKAEGDVLVASGMAEWLDKLPKTGTLVGAVNGEGVTVPLEKWNKPELFKLASDMGIEGADGMTKAELVTAIKAVPVEPGEEEGEEGPEADEEEESEDEQGEDTVEDDEPAPDAPEPALEPGE